MNEWKEWQRSLKMYKGSLPIACKSHGFVYSITFSEPFYVLHKQGDNDLTINYMISVTNVQILVTGWCQVSKKKKYVKDNN